MRAKKGDYVYYVEMSRWEDHELHTHMLGLYTSYKKARKAGM